MNRIAIVVALVAGIAVPSHATPYLAPCIQKSMGFSVAVTHPSDSAGVYDLAYECHKQDPNNSIIPKAWQSYIAPETWAIGASVGGSFNGSAIVSPFTVTANVAPVLATLFLHAVDETKPTAQGQVKGWLLGQSGAAFRLGGGFAPVAIDNGHFQSLKAMFNQRGLMANLSNVARVNVGLAW